MKDLLWRLAEVVGVEEDTLSPQTRLKELPEWDSLTALTVVIMIGDDYGLVVTAEELAAVDTVEGLERLVQSKIEKSPL